MIAPELATQERLLGAPARSLYLRGRSAVLGDPPPHVVAELFGLLPIALVEMALARPGPVVPAAQAIEAYSTACWEWGRHHLAEIGPADRLADLLVAVSDAADASALALFAGWRAAPRPADPPARLAHALMVARELRGGLHFAALRASGLGVADAVLLDPEGGPERLRQTGWRDQDVEIVRARLTGHDDLPERWQRAQDLTDEVFGGCLAVLTAPERSELAAGLALAA